jgi:hypothetical protein
MKARLVAAGAAHPEQPRIGRPIAYSGPMTSAAGRRPTLGIVSPFYNECRQSALFIARVTVVLDTIGTDWSLVCVNDGSRSMSAIRASR